jgi:hypothetical protein
MLLRALKNLQNDSALSKRLTGLNTQGSLDSLVVNTPGVFSHIFLHDFYGTRGSQEWIRPTPGIFD